MKKLLLFILFLLTMTFETQAQVITSEGIVCSNHSQVGITDENATSIKWTSSQTGVYIVSSTSKTTDVLYLSQGTNVFTCSYTDSKGNIVTQQVNVTYKVPYSNAGTTKESCDNTITLVANVPPSNGSGYWTQTGGSGTFTSNTNYTLYVQGLSTGESRFRWTVTESNCTAYSDVVVTNNFLTVDAGTSHEICDASTSLAGTALQSGDVGKWTIESASGIIENPTLSNTNVSGLSSGLNTLRWTIQRGSCTFSNTIGLTYNQINVDAGNNQSICQNSSYLAGNNPAYVGTTATGEWKKISGSVYIVNINAYNSQVTDIQRGESRLRWTVTYHGCSAYKEMTILNNTPSTPIVNGTQIICQSQTSLYAAVPQYGQGLWSLKNGSATIANISENSTTVSGLIRGTSTFVWTITYGYCSASAEVVVTSNATMSNAGGQQTFCRDNTILYASMPDGATGKWTCEQGAGSFLYADQAITTVSGLSKGKNVMRWTVTQDDCTAVSTVALYNSLPSDATVVGTGGILCTNSVTIDAIQPNYGVGVWSLYNGNFSIGNTNLLETNLTNIQTGTNVVRWTVTNGECTSYTDLTFQYSIIKANAGIDKKVCATNLQLHAADVNTTTKGVWSVVEGAGTFDNENDIGTMVRGLKFGINRFRWWITENNCTASDTVMIENSYPTQAQVMASVPSTCETTYQLTANTPEFGTGQWTIIAGSSSISNVSIANPTVSNLQRGANTFRWVITADECTTYAETSIISDAVVASAGTDKEICETDYTLSALLSESTDIGIWSILQGSGTLQNPSYSNTKVIGIGTGENVFRWKVKSTGGCVDSKDIHIYNYKNVAKTGDDITTCDNQAYISANSPTIGTAEWSIYDGSATISNKNINITQVSNLKSGTTTFRWTITAGTCVVYSDLRITNKGITANAGEDIIVCKNATASMLANDLGTGLWSVESGAATITTPTSYHTQVTNLQRGDNVLMWSISKNGCTAFDLVTVSNNEFEVTLPTTQDYVCEHQATITADAATAGVWTCTENGILIESPSNYQTKVSNLAEGLTNFQWTAQNKGCKVVTDFKLINEGFVPDAGTDLELCQNFTQLHAYVTDAQLALGAKGKWEDVNQKARFDYPQGTTDTSVLPNETVNPMVYDLQAGLNQLKWTIYTSHCSASDIVKIQNNGKTYSAGTDFSICENHANLSADAVPNTAKAHWESYDSNTIITNSLSNTTQVKNLKWGQNVFKWIVVEGACKSESLVSLYNKSFNAQTTGTEQTTDTYFSTDAYPSGTDVIGSWTPIEGTTATIVSTTLSQASITNLDFGYNSFLWKAEKDGCTSYDTLDVIRTFTVEAGANQSFCNDTTTMSATVSSLGAGKWRLVSGQATILDPNSPTTKVTSLTNKGAVLRWSVIKNRYEAFDDVVLSNKIKITVSQSQQVCSNSTLLVATKSSGTGKWSVIYSKGTLRNASALQTLVTDMEEGDNVFRYSVSDGTCANHDDVSISYATPSVAQILNKDTIVCSNSTYLNALAIDKGIGTWSVIVGRGVFSNASLQNVNVKDLATASNRFRWTTSNGICTAISEVNVYFNAIHAQIVKITDVKCADLATGAVNLKGLDGSGGYFYSIDEGKTFPNSDGFFERLYAGTYTMIVKDSKGCSTENLYATISEPDPIKVSLVTCVNSTTPTAKNGYFELESEGGVAPYTYSLLNLTYTIPTFGGLSEGSYKVKVTDANQCTQTETVNLLMGTISDIEISTNESLGLRLYPNPAISNVTISYSIDYETHVSMDLYEITGKKVAQIFDGTAQQGKNEVNFSAQQLNAGIYLIHISTSNQTETLKLVIRK